MNDFLILAGLIVIPLAVLYRREPVLNAALAFAALTVLGMMLGAGGGLTALAGLAAVLTGLAAHRGLRTEHVTRRIFSWFKTVLPQLSPTEQGAIDAGTVWWDGELFSGAPDWNKLSDQPRPDLTADDIAFLEGPVEELIRMSDAWNVNHNWQVIPPKVLDFIKSEGFFSLIIPKQYGGRDLSPVAQSEVVSRLATAGGGIANLVAVPNSLGPGELLLKYGTEEQRDYYLPRLARGEEIPCFALTGPLAGSDATSLPDTGVVCKGEWNGEEVIGMRLTFNKRYITLAPIATLIGLAFRLQDPEHLIGDTDDYGITCALIPRATPGVEIGRRHMPIGDTFMNGPIEGEDVFVPLDYIIGGVENAGKGWRMLVNCLSVGRCITLPSGGDAAARRMLMGTSAYASLRRQFGVPIRRFEGVQKPLARIAGLSYIINAARLNTVHALKFGEKPSVASAILKYHCTEMARQACLDAMDIHGGKAVMKGPKNYVAPAYESIPVAITVEGANIMTRNLMIFGQGATRSHPYVLQEMMLAARDDDEAVKEFDKVFFGHVGFTLSNATRSLLLALTGSRLSNPRADSPVARYYSHVNRLSSAFALVADVSMLTLQGKLKFKEMLSARLGDLLSNLFLASMVLKQYENDGSPAEDLPLVTWSLDHLLNRYQVAMEEILQNYPNRAIAVALRALVFPLGAHFAAPEDRTDTAVADLVCADSGTRQRLVKGIFTEVLPNNPLGHVNAVFLDSLKNRPLYERLREAVKAGTIAKLQGTALVEAGREAGVLSDTEAHALLEFDKALMEVIHVDDFAESELVRQAYQETQALREAV